MKKETKKKIAIGAGIASIAAAAAGAYFLTSTKKGKQVRKQIASWANKAKKEVAADIKKMGAVNKKNYEKVVSAVMARYRAVKNIDPKEIAALSKELKGHWNSIKKDIEKRMPKKPAAKKKVIRKK